MKHLLFITLFSAALFSKADEGMYLPFQLKKNQKDMAAKGLELSIKEIYNPKAPSVKDAIVSLGGFCTAEIISAKGLMLTNHHCGYDAIRENSTPENDYLTDGFWAMNYAEEKPVPGLTASIVVRIDDVSKTMNKALKNITTETQRDQVIRQMSQELAEKAVAGTHYTAEVKPFYEGNEFYLFIYEVFTDIRLVGAPPSAIGKFGGDTDNWMWERHTGDFSMFRIYADENNQPANFSMTNKPYSPKHYLPVSMNGVAENDFAMVMGYPGTTKRFLTSFGVKMAIEKDQPSRVKVRGEKLRIMDEAMKRDDVIRLQYASTYAQVSNYWKYYIGQTEQLQKNKVLAKKLGIEKAFSDWVNAKEKRKQRYGNVLKDMEDAYVTLNKTNATSVYFFEAIYLVSINNFALKHRRLYANLSEKEVNTEAVKNAAKKLAKEADDYFESIHLETELKLLGRSIDLYFENVPKEQHNEKLTAIAAEYENDWGRVIQEIKSNSVFTDLDRYKKFIQNPTTEVMDNDLLFSFDNAFLNSYLEVVNSEKSVEAQNKLNAATRLFVEALRLMNPDKKYYPNANSTLRLTYGNVLPYTSIEGKSYPFYTTIDGLMAKEDASNPDFIVPEKLKALYEAKDYGRYAKNGELWVNFITNNDITGGNSGSPVINGKGELIGCAFDGNWEAMSGDISFENDFQRTICVDIRYILFIIDKYAGASHLIDEMTLVGSN